MFRIKFVNLMKCLAPMRNITNVPVVLSRDIVKTPAEPVRQSERENRVVLRIKETNDSHELLELMTKINQKEVDSFQLMQALNQLFTLQKNGYNSIHPSQLMRHPGFGAICTMLKFKAPKMEGNDLVQTLKVLSYFGVKSESMIVQRVLQLLKDQLNHLSPNNLIFLNFLFERMHKTPLIEALLIALPMVFELNLSQRMDHNNVTELVELLHFLSRSPMKVSKKSVMNIITALTLHGTTIEVKEAMSIVWSLLSMPQFEEAEARLYNNCMKVLNTGIEEISFEDVEGTLGRIVPRIQAGQHSAYNEKFFENVAKMVVERDESFIRTSYILKKFNKIKFVSYEILDHLDRKIVSNHANLSSCKAAGLMTFAGSYSNACYKSDNWEILKSLLHENPMMQSDRIDVPWLKFAIDLFALGFHSNMLLERVFSTEFLEKFLKRNNQYDQMQLLLLWQCVKLLLPEYDGPLPEQRYIDDATIVNLAKPNEALVTTLANVFGGREFIQSNVVSSHGHCLDCVISFDANENPIAMPCRVFRYDDIPKSQVRSLAIFFHGRQNTPYNYPEKLRGIFELKKRTIEALGIKTVNISTAVLNNLPQDEQNSYLDREIRYGLR